MTKKEGLFLVGLAELIVLIASVLTTIGPSKRKSDWMLSSIIFDSPTTLHEILAWIALLHLFVAMLIMGFWLKRIVKKKF